MAYPSITLDTLPHLLVGDIAALPLAQLVALSDEATQELQRFKQSKELIEAAIGIKYSQRLHALRQAQQKPTGTMHLEDEGFLVTQEIPKKPDWDQDKLQTVVAKIAAAGENPEEYVDIAYKVAERKYTAWPEHIRAAFEGARILKTGKAVFTVKPVGGVQ
jgi:hypothetical protein